MSPRMGAEEGSEATPWHLRGPHRAARPTSCTLAIEAMGTRARKMTLTEPERGMTLIPRRALDVGQNEIARAYKLAGGTISPMSFMVPRKAESFQSE